MRQVGLLLTVAVAVILLAGGAVRADQGVGVVSGEGKKWHPITVSFPGPTASENNASPNPFLDYRLRVTFTGPSGQVYEVPGFFDGDGSGAGMGDVWRVRFAPDEVGRWSYEASFRTGSNVAVDMDPNAGTSTHFDGTTGSFDVGRGDPGASGFLRWGLLEYVGGHYLKFRDGPYWLKGGADSPENLLGYGGFDNTPYASHSFSPHVPDWQAEDPVLNVDSSDGGKGLIGAVNYLASRNVNSVYFLPMNIGGDAQDTSPFVNVSSWEGSTGNDNLHYDISKLRQWETAFSHMQEKGVHLHFVLNEAECPNKVELDNGTLGVERKLFYRELIARFGHHNALQWNISEEYDLQCSLGTERVKEFAGYIRQVDPYDHPITVHQSGNPDATWTPFLGDPLFSLTSFQYAKSVAGYGAEVEEWRAKSREAGWPVTVSMDELRPTSTTNQDAQRKEILWPTYLSGGQIEWYMGGDRALEDFRKYQAIWDYTWYARQFMQENLPYWEMEPNDALLTDESPNLGGGQVSAKAGEVYTVYLPDASVAGSLDLSSAPQTFEQRWYNPRTGDFEGEAVTVEGGGNVALGTPPSSPAEDWIVLLKTCAPSCPPGSSDTTLPTVTGKTPTDGTTAVAVGTDATATFSEAMEEASVEASGSFILTEQGATTPVAATVTLSADGKQATLDPVADLKANTTYTAKVTTAPKDLAGNSLGNAETWSFTTASGATPTGNGLTGQYYGDESLSAIKITRIDPEVDFTWGTGSPDPSIAPDNFSVRWSGQIKVDHSEAYTFYVTANDGVRLWVDHQPIVKRWGWGTETDTGTVTLQADQWHDIKLEYYEGIKSANIALEYASASTPKQVIPSDHLRVSANR